MTLTLEQVVTGELVTTKGTTTPDPRHAVCGYVMVQANQRGMVHAFCGALVLLPLPRADARVGERCKTCEPLAITHAAHCGCFKLWDHDARLPR